MNAPPDASRPPKAVIQCMRTWGTTTVHRMPRRVPNRERGLAAVLAILIVALAASTAIYLVWQQTVVVRQMENLTARAQIREIARAALSWAAAILRQDDPKIDDLNEAWAQPLPPIRVEQATLAGGITDEQSKFNLNNLLSAANSNPGANRAAIANDPNAIRFRMLLTQLNLDPALCDALIDWIDPDSNVTAPGGAEDNYYLGLDPPYRAANRTLASIGELRLVKGFTPDAIDRLAPYVTVLPDPPTALNVNTMPPEIMSVLLPEVQAGAIIDARKRAPFATLDDFKKLLTDDTKSQLKGLIDKGLIDIKSSYFSARATVTLGRTSITYRAILHRPGNKAAWPTIVTFTEEPM